MIFSEFFKEKKPCSCSFKDLSSLIEIFFRFILFKFSFSIELGFLRKNQFYKRIKFIKIK